jgi:DNA gyrase subunit A
LRDESNREGIRVVFEIRRDAAANVVLNNLYKYSNLQTAFSVNNIALANGRPVVMNVRDIIAHFVDHRHEVIIRRTKYELSEAEKRAHILEGLLIALDHIDEVIQLIKESQSPEIAREGLMSRFNLSEIQARAILDMRLQQLTGLQQDKIRAEYEELMKLITRLKEILADEKIRMGIIKDETNSIKEKYGDPRRSIIEYAAEEFRMEDMIENEEVVITISHLGYIKRTPLTEYRKQNRGGRGFSGSGTRNEDFIEHIFVAHTHNYMLFFTEQGKCFWTKVYEIPEATKQSKGRAVQNLLNLAPEDKIRAYITVKNLDDAEYLDQTFIVFATKQGVIKKTSLEAFSRPRSNGINALNINEGDQLIQACLTTGSSEILLAVKSGRAIRFPEAKVRPMGRSATGVRGIELDDDHDEVIGMVCVDDRERSILVLSEKGYGKRSAIEDYRVTNRGGKGVKTLNITDKTGLLVAITDVSDADDLMIINKSGVTIRMGVKELRVMGRNTQGVRLIRLDESDAIASIARVEHEEETPDSEQEEGNDLPENNTEE